MAKDEKIPVCDAINAAIKQQEDPPIFEVKAPVKVSVLGADDRYRTINLKDEEFFLKGIRPGKKSEYIIELKPVAAAGYVQAEILDKDLPNIMPELERALIQMLGHESARFKLAAKKFIATHKEEEEKAQAKAESVKYDTNPNWGSF